MDIDASSFGNISIDGKRYDYDVVVYPSTIERRKKQITKRQHGTSHKFSKKELEEYLRKIEADEIEILYVGQGHNGRLGLLEEARNLLREKSIDFVELKTSEAAEKFMDDERPRENKMAIFHTTC
ncbi:hypothetical protein AKJ52_01270 [candidate division MSBL1 archaeon SCGC-AAA382C18]|uniref:Uncharacterized protein n=1 Tax=candidate division MSBL1 archaeon SCGC-AAA382C18 TaxID=1698281 RepID=A0A133VKK6_9EURY|nr:hypothetical protein AKJ52_01270 [candidate division MSBL1 archaeon SCGC-AAA382C18]